MKITILYYFTLMYKSTWQQGTVKHNVVKLSKKLFTARTGQYFKRKLQKICTFVSCDKKHSFKSWKQQGTKFSNLYFKSKFRPPSVG